MSAAFPEKLRLVLKLLSMSGAQLAAGLGVDKSVVSRWLNGAVKPSEHNLTLLTQLVASRTESFRLIDWERDLKGLAELFGAEADAGAAQGARGRAGRPAAGLSLAIWDQAVLTTSQRGRAYEGFWRILRPSDAPGTGGFAFDYSIVQHVEPPGLLRMTLSSFGAIADGWLMPLHNQLYGILSDDTSGGLTFIIMNGLAHTKVDAIDGIALGTSLDAGRTPTALAVFCERIGDLTGDAAEDERRFRKLAEECPQPTPADLTPEMLAHLLPEFGPGGVERGGDVVMQVKRSRSMARSAPPRELVAAGRPRVGQAEPASAPFAEKLRLILKLLSLSGAQLAAPLEVDKSVVSRWLSGGVEPSAHNLARLTALIADKAPGFTMLDWDRSLESLAELLGADPSAIPALNRADGVLTLSLWDQIMATSALRGAAYEGFFRITRPSVLEPDGYIQEYGLIEPHPSGLWRFRLGSFGAMLDGWMLPLHDQLYFLAADILSGVLLFGIFNGVGAAKVDVVDGLTLSPNLDVSRSPTAMAVISEHVEDLSGDPEADERRFLELAGQKRIAPPDQVDEKVRRRLDREGGLQMAQQGGDPLLTMPLKDSLARARGFRAPRT